MGVCDSKSDNIDLLTNNININTINKLEKNICKIYKIKDGGIENGFFSLIPYPDKSKSIPALITNNKILNMQDISLNKTIKIFYNDNNNNKVEKLITINNNRKVFTDEDIDITIIEIIPDSDGIKVENFLQIDEEIFKNNYNDIYKEHDIYMLLYPNSNTSSYYKGTLKSIGDKKIYFTCNEDTISPGLPILSVPENKVIGISQNNNEGVSIRIAFEKFNNMNNNKNNILCLNDNKISKCNNIIEMVIENNDENEIDEDNNIYRICTYIENSINNPNNYKNNNCNNNNEIQNKSCIELYINDKAYDYKKCTKLPEGIYNFKIVINAMITDCRNLFVSCCKNLISLNLSGFDVKYVGNMSYMFRNCEKLKKIDFSNFDTSNTINMSRMFMDCKSLVDLNLSNFNVKNVKKMGYMFHGCENLINLNISSFNTINVKEMNDMFHGCKNLTSIDLSPLDTKNVTNMSRMFMDCNSLKNINLANFDTRNVTNLSRMFMNCKNLENVNLKNFDVGNVTDMNRMFFECDNLKSVNLSFVGVGINNNNINVECMFNGCINLKEIYLNQKLNNNIILNQIKNDKINAKIFYA
jgi:surface protein